MLHRIMLATAAAIIVVVLQDDSQPLSIVSFAIDSQNSEIALKHCSYHPLEGIATTVTAAARLDTGIITAAD